MAALLLVCCDGRASDRTAAPQAPARTAKVPAAGRAPAADAAVPVAKGFDKAQFRRKLAHIERRRKRFARRYAAARTEAQRRAIRRQARAYVVDAIVEDIFPAWIGTPWGMGRNSTSTIPHQPGMTVGCSYFVTSVLLNAGLELDNRYRFAQAPALFIQRSLTPARRSLQRYFSIPARDLEARIARHGDGLYVIGLVNHIAFVVVRDGAVRLVHSGYVPTSDVIDEPFASAQVIAISKQAGYFVTPLFADDRLIDHWLRGKPVRFQKLGV